jgi:hypothetical protein
MANIKISELEENLRIGMNDLMEMSCLVNGSYVSRRIPMWVMQLAGTTTKPRKTVTETTTLVKNDVLISVNPAAATDITLDVAPVDGQVTEIYAVSLAHPITIKGPIDGVADLVINNVYDNIRLIYNDDEGFWESR